MRPSRTTPAWSAKPEAGRAPTLGINPLDGSYLSVILFDEIEKAHPLLWNALLGILEDGRLTLGDNTVVDFTHSIIVMTSNVGSQDMDAELERRPVGFRAALGPDIGERHSITQTALAATGRSASMGRNALPSST